MVPNKYALPVGVISLSLKMTNMNSKLDVNTCVTLMNSLGIYITELATI